jgi:hypothetical protein
MSRTEKIYTDLKNYPNLKEADKLYKNAHENLETPSLPTTANISSADVTLGASKKHNFNQTNSSVNK